MVVLNWFKKNWVHFAFVAVLLLVTLVYFSPVFEGQTIKQTDVTNWIGASKDIQDYRGEYGEEPLWSTGSFMGMSAENISVERKGDVLKTAYDALSLWLPAPANYLFLAFISFYIMMLCFKAKPWVALVGALAFGFSSYFIIILEAGHNTKAVAIAFMPGVIGGAYQALRGNFLRGAGISALFMALQLRSNHPQISYYLGMILGFVFLVELIRVITVAVKAKTAANLKKFGFGVLGLAIAYILAIGVNYSYLSMVKNASEFSIRGPSELTIDKNLKPIEGSAGEALSKEYITQWSYGRDETFTIIAPNAKGGESGVIGQDEELMKKVKKMRLRNLRKNANQSMTYWGDQPFTSGPVYFGGLIVVLALLALVYVKSPWKWGLISVAVLTTMLSWGHNFIGLSDYIYLQLAIVLFAIGNYMSNNKIKYGLLGAGALVFLFAFVQWGSGETGLTDFFIDNVPFYNKFRAVTMILTVGMLCFPILATLFIAEVAKRKEEIAKKPLGLYVVSGFAVVFMLIFMSSPSTFVDLNSAAEYTQLEQLDEAMTNIDKYPAQQQDYIKSLSKSFEELEEFRASVVKSDVVRSLVFIVFGLLLVIASVMFKGLKPKFVLPVLGVLFLFDMAGVGKRYLNNDPDPKNKKAYAQWIGVDQKNYPLSPMQADLDILAMEVEDDEALAAKVDAAEKLALKEEKNLALGKLKHTERGRLVTTDYSNNYVNAAKFGALDLNTNYRVLDLTSSFTQSSRASYFHKSFGGYHGAKPRKWQEVVDFYMSRTVDQNIINMANVKYLIQNGGEGQAPRAVENPTNLGAAWLVKDINTVASADDEIKAIGDLYEIEDLTGTNSLIVNGEPTNKTLALGSMAVELNQDTSQKGFDIPYSRMLQGIKDEIVVGSDSANVDVHLPAQYFQGTGVKQLAPKHFRIKRLNEFDPAKEAVMTEQFKENLSAESYSAKGTIEQTGFKANELVYAFESNDKQFAVFSELYHPVGWKATIDGEEVAINRVNYLLRGIEIPAGKHEIKFTYDIEDYRASGWKNASMGSLILILFFAGLFAPLFMKKKEEEVEEAA